MPAACALWPTARPPRWSSSWMTLLCSFPGDIAEHDGRRAGTEGGLSSGWNREVDEPLECACHRRGTGCRGVAGARGSSPISRDLPAVGQRHEKTRRIDVRRARFRGADDGVRTRDPDLGKVVLYQLSHVRIVKRAVLGHPSPQGGANGGDARIRTGGEGFAGLCLTTWPRRRVAAKPSWKRPAKTLEYDRPRDDDGADDGVRTRDPDLGKVVLYQLSHVRVARRYNTGTTPFAQAPISDFFTSR